MDRDKRVIVVEPEREPQQIVYTSVLMVPFDELTKLIHEELDNNTDRHIVFHFIQRLTTKAVYAVPEEKNNG